MFAALMLLIGFLGPPLWMTTPRYPADAIGGQTVVAAIHVRSGYVTGVDVLSGGDPFTLYARRALFRWRFAPGPPGEALVVVRYRRPEVFSMGGTHQTLAPFGGPYGLPYPTQIVDPVYPSNDAIVGGVVFALNVSPYGNVMGARTLKPLGRMTSLAAEAVLNWHFRPAVVDGRSIPSQVYAVIVFPPPLH